MKKGYAFLILMSFIAQGFAVENSIDRIDKNFGITALTDKVYLVQSSYAANGHLDCNNLLIIDKEDLVLINTPVNDSLTLVLLNCIATKFKRKVTKVIASHFHDDSSGGLLLTQKSGIISYGLDKTRDLLRSERKDINQVFSDSLTITLQSLRLELKYFGPGHSIDNIVIWIPNDKILFGGCLIKSLDAKDIGNIADADLKAWPATVRLVKERFADARIVIPGHLSIGDSSIFDYTLKIIAAKKD